MLPIVVVKVSEPNLLIRIDQFLFFGFLTFRRYITNFIELQGIKTVGRAVIKEEKDKVRNAKKFSLLVEGLVYDFFLLI